MTTIMDGWTKLNELQRWALLDAARDLGLFPRSATVRVLVRRKYVVPEETRPGFRAATDEGQDLVRLVLDEDADLRRRVMARRARRHRNPKEQWSKDQKEAERYWRKRKAEVHEAILEGRKDVAKAAASVMAYEADAFGVGDRFPEEWHQRKTIEAPMLRSRVGHEDAACTWFVICNEGSDVVNTTVATPQLGCSGICDGDGP